jgi:hypothetical protein|tara:strand:+ start:332 stop:622 length:291 start_codon:yes stop_codon:yes gene_type:complete
MDLMEALEVVVEELVQLLDLVVVVQEIHLLQIHHKEKMVVMLLKEQDVLKVELVVVEQLLQDQVLLVVQVDHPLVVTKVELVELVHLMILQDQLLQ